MTDAQIVSLFWSRQECAVAHTKEKYGALLRSIARNILHSEQDAEECESDALLRLWNAIPPQKPQKLGAFAAKIVRNLALNRYLADHTQKRNCELEVALEELEDCLAGADCTENGAELREISQGIDAFLRKQSQQARVIFLRRYWLTESLSETASVLGITESAVKSSLFRTRRALAAYLKQEGYLE